MFNPEQFPHESEEAAEPSGEAMAEQPERPKLRKYEELSVTEKLRVVLSEVGQPVTRQFALELSGLDMEK